MKIASGWMRLWVALSVLWVVPVLIIGGVSLKNIQTPAQKKAADAGWACKDYASVPTTDLLALYGEERLVRAYRTGGGDTPEHKKLIQDCGKALTRDYAAVRQRELVQTVGMFGLCALIPPLLLLALGWLAAWVVRGFRTARA
jgi:hypothetical protein